MLAAHHLGPNTHRQFKELTHRLKHDDLRGSSISASQTMAKHRCWTLPNRYGHLQRLQLIDRGDARVLLRLRSVLAACGRGGLARLLPLPFAPSAHVLLCFGIRPQPAASSAFVDRGSVQFRDKAKLWGEAQNQVFPATADFMKSCASRCHCSLMCWAYWWKIAGRGDGKYSSSMS